MSDKTFGWKPQKPDFRDFKLSIPELSPIQSVYLYDKYKMPLPYDQGQIGACTASALAFLVQFDMLNKDAKNNISPYCPSRLFIYYNERMMEGTVNQDAGAELRDGIKALATWGAPSEDAWIYDVTKFAEKPPEHVYQLGTRVEGLTYELVDNTNKQLLVNVLLQGFPMCFGMTVYESFMTDEVARTGIVPMPKVTESVVGGHAIVIEGYSEKFDSFIIRNSWGTSWGQGGYCRIPAAYICNPDLATDFWKLTFIS